MNISIPEIVESIGDAAFSYCRSITNFSISPANKHYTIIDGVIYSKDKKTLVEFLLVNESSSFTVPQEVTSIQSFAFYGCRSLVSIIIPDSVKSIGDKAFCNCHNLKKVIKSRFCKCASNWKKDRNKW